MDYDDDGSRLAQSIEPGGNRRLMIEDDGLTCYAYYFVDDQIAAHAWLYNVEPPAPLSSYDESKSVPPANEAENILDETPVRLDRGIEVRCDWRETGVDIYLAETRIATFENGEKPGRSRLVRVDSALARRL